MKNLVLITVLFLVSCSTTYQKQGHIAQKKEINNYAEMYQDLTQEAEGFNKEKVLVVFDIDNTSLKNTINLGSEQWFYWQESLLSTNSSQRVGKNFDELLRVQGIMFALDPMNLTDPKLDEVLKTIQDEGMKTIVLTSRGPDFRNDTERTLLANGLDFRRTKVGEDIGGDFLPYKLSELSEKEKGFVGNKEARVTTYVNGIFMTQGQHKGVMLESLLKRFKYKPELIVFIDNHEKQVNRVYESFENYRNVIVYRYAGYDTEYAKMDLKSHQNKADQDFKNLRKYLDGLFKRKVIN